MNKLLQASINLMDFLHNNPVNGFDVPDEIWLPFTEAIDYEQRRVTNDKMCHHWIVYNRGGSGEFGSCNCNGEIGSL